VIGVGPRRARKYPPICAATGSLAWPSLLRLNGCSALPIPNWPI